MNIKYLGLEIGGSTPDRADGYVSFVEVDGNGRVSIRKKHLFVVSNDGSFLKSHSEKEINKDLFKSEATCLFMKFVESNFIQDQHMFSVRFFNRPHKNIPSTTITRFNQGDNSDFIVESSLLFNNRPVPKKPYEKPTNQPPANQETIVPTTVEEVPETPPAPATAEQLQNLVSKHNQQ